MRPRIALERNCVVVLANTLRRVHMRTKKRTRSPGQSSTTSQMELPQSCQITALFFSDKKQSLKFFMKLTFLWFVFVIVLTYSNAFKLTGIFSKIEFFSIFFDLLIHLLCNVYKIIQQWIGGNFFSFFEHQCFWKQYYLLFNYSCNYERGQEQELGTKVGFI